MLRAVFIRILSVLVILPTVVWTGTAVSAADWQAGVAKVRITPERPMWMSGLREWTACASTAVAMRPLSGSSLNSSTAARQAEALDA